MLQGRGCCFFPFFLRCGDRGWQGDTSNSLAVTATTGSGHLRSDRRWVPARPSQPAACSQFLGRFGNAVVSFRLAGE